MRGWIRIALVVVGLLVATHIAAHATTIDFEGLADSDPVTNQFPGITFSNTIAFTAGISLNEFEFPPHSGMSVVFDDGGSIAIVFDTPQSEVSGFFTYTTQLTLMAFDAANNSVAIDTSDFSSNLALSGDPGSSPNELLGVFSLTNNIAHVMIAGDLSGGSFTLDDLTFTQVTTQIPEPSTLILLATGIIGLIGRSVWRFTIGKRL